MSFFSKENHVLILIKDILNKEEEETEEKSTSLYRISADITSLKHGHVDNKFRGWLAQVRERQRQRSAWAQISTIITKGSLLLAWRDSPWFTHWKGGIFASKTVQIGEGILSVNCGSSVMYCLLYYNLHHKRKNFSLPLDSKGQDDWLSVCIFKHSEPGQEKSNRVVAVNSSPIPGALEFWKFYSVEIF